MILVRSLAYYVFLTGSVLVYGLPLATLGWVMPMDWRHAIGNAWGRANLRMLGVLCGLRYRIEGAENLPRGR